MFAQLRPVNSEEDSLFFHYECFKGYISAFSTSYFIEDY